jgi:hypothetical protein
LFFRGVFEIPLLKNAQEHQLKENFPQKTKQKVPGLAPTYLHYLPHSVAGAGASRPPKTRGVKKTIFFENK